MLAVIDPETAGSSGPSAADDQAFPQCRLAGAVAIVRRDVCRRVANYREQTTGNKRWTL